MAGGTQHKSDLHRSLLPVQTGADPVPDPGLPALRRPDGRRLPAGPVASAEIPDRLIAPLPPTIGKGGISMYMIDFSHIYAIIIMRFCMQPKEGNYDGDIRDKTSK